MNRDPNSASVWSVPRQKSRTRVAVLSVPFRPQRRKVADLIPAFADIPRFRDQLHLADHRILLNQIEERRQPIDVVQLAGERRGEVEPESVDVHLENPVPQAVHDQLQHMRVTHVQRVAGAGVVHVIAAVVGHQPVVGRVVDPFEREDRAEVIAFGGVVVDDVEDHFDAGRMQRLDEILELQHLLAALPGRGVLVVRREVANRVVAPVVPQSAIEERRVLHELMHGQQFDRRDSQALQVFDRDRDARDRRRCRAAPPGCRRGVRLKPLTCVS